MQAKDAPRMVFNNLRPPDPWDFARPRLTGISGRQPAVRLVPDDRAYFKNRLKRVEEAMADAMARFPPRLVRLTEESDHGQVVVTHTVTKVEGGVTKPGVGHYSRHSGVVSVTPEALRKNLGVAEEEVIHLLDHLLGSGGKGANLSEGPYRSDRLQSLSEEIVNLAKRVDLGKNARKNNREWLAQALRWYLSVPAELQELAPEVYTLMERWFSEEFWQSVL